VHFVIVDPPKRQCLDSFTLLRRSQARPAVNAFEADPQHKTIMFVAMNGRDHPTDRSWGG
jgi:hypothetical protein